MNPCLPGAAALLTALTGCVTQPEMDFKPGIPFRMNLQEQGAIKTGLAMALKDPASAILGPAAAARDADGFVYVCGTVNSRNGFGGYVGFTPYFGMMTEIPGT